MLREFVHIIQHQRPRTNFRWYQLRGKQPSPDRWRMGRFPPDLGWLLRDGSTMDTDQWLMFAIGTSVEQFGHGIFSCPRLSLNQYRPFHGGYQTKATDKIFHGVAGKDERRTMIDDSRLHRIFYRRDMTNTR